MVPLALLLACAPELQVDADDDTAADTAAPASAQDQQADGPTWNDDVAALVQDQCTACHGAGGVASPDLSSYDDAARWAELIALAVETDVMPPSNVDATGSCQDFVDARALSDRQVALLRAWADAGAPLGEGEAVVADTPTPAALDEVDVSLETAMDHVLHDSGEQWRCYLLETDEIDQPWLRGYQLVPQDGDAVHHATVYSLPVEAAVGEARALDEADPDPGYSCPNGVEVGAYEVMALYNPGTPATTFPEGTGLDFDPTRPLLVRAHYSAAGPAGLTVQLDLADSVEHEAQLLGFSNDRFELPPGEPTVEISVDLSLPGTSDDRLTVYGVNPHMHDYGRTQHFELDPEGDATCLSTTPVFQADWQQLYWYSEPLVLEGGAPLRLSCGYDTTTATEPVHFGQSYVDEMCVMQLYAVLD